eukprot:scaffold3348_cov379-Prasinococcus_capsulatus_cf.AAC.2
MPLARRERTYLEIVLSLFLGRLAKPSRLSEDRHADPISTVAAGAGIRCSCEELRRRSAIHRESKIGRQAAQASRGKPAAAVSCDGQHFERSHPLAQGGHALPPCIASGHSDRNPVSQRQVEEPTTCEAARRACLCGLGPLGPPGAAWRAPATEQRRRVMQASKPCARPAAHVARASPVAQTSRLLAAPPRP